MHFSPDDTRKISMLKIHYWSVAGLAVSNINAQYSCHIETHNPDGDNYLTNLENNKQTNLRCLTIKIKLGTIWTLFSRPLGAIWTLCWPRAVYWQQVIFPTIRKQCKSKPTLLAFQIWAGMGGRIQIWVTKHSSLLMLACSRLSWVSNEAFQQILFLLQEYGSHGRILSGGGIATATQINSLHATGAQKRSLLQLTRHHDGVCQ